MLTVTTIREGISEARYVREADHIDAMNNQKAELLGITKPQAPSLESQCTDYAKGLIDQYRGEISRLELTCASLELSNKALDKRISVQCGEIGMQRVKLHDAERRARGAEKAYDEKRDALEVANKKIVELRAQADRLERRLKEIGDRKGDTAKAATGWGGGGGSAQRAPESQW